MIFVFTVAMKILNITPILKMRIEKSKVVGW